MRKLLAIWLILFLSLSLGNAVPVMAQEERFEREDADLFSPPATRRLEESRERGRRRGLPERWYVTPEQEEKALRYLEENEPEAFEHLTRLKESEPLKYHRLLAKKMRQMRFLKDLKKRDPKRYEKAVRIGELEQRSQQLAEEYKESKDAEEKENIKASIRGRLNELFDLKQEEREAGMERLEEELKRLQENIIRRKENKETIVNRRLKEMTGDADYLRW